MPLSILSLLSKLAMTLAQFGAAALVLVHLSASEQGYYYSFLALIAIQTLFELGLSQVLVVYLSHECRENARTGGIELHGVARAGAIARASLRQYLRLSAAYLLAVGTLGLVFFGHVHQDGSASAPSSWLHAWLATVLVSALRLPLMWIEAALEGLGHLSWVLCVRIMAHLIWLLAFWASLRAGAGLYSLTLALVALTMFSFALYFRHAKVLLNLIRTGSNNVQAIDWKQESGLLQRRVSGTWIASYVISSTPVPLAMTLLGPVEAGVIGMALQFAAAIGVIAGSLAGPKISQASRLFANQELAEYRRLLGITLRRAVLAGALIAALAILVLLLAPAVRPMLQGRLPSLDIATPLLAAALINSALSCVAVFARAQKKELFMFPLLVNAAITFVGTLILHGYGGLQTIALLHLLAAMLITAPAVWSGYRLLRS